MNRNLNIILVFCLIWVTLISNGKEKKQKHNIYTYAEETVPERRCRKILPQPEDEEKDKDKNNLLSEFKTYNIGKNIQPGSVTTEDSIIEIAASGTDIWGTEDEGYFVFKQIKGDFEISVRVHSLSASNLYTKAGIMARQDLSGNSKHVYFLVFPDNQERNNNNGGCEFQYRQKRGGESKAIYPGQQTGGDFNVNFPETWVKLKREGNIFSSFIGSNNENWHLYSTHEQKMPKRLLLGLAVTSHNSYGYTRTEFSELEIKN